MNRKNQRRALTRQIRRATGLALPVCATAARWIVSGRDLNPAFLPSETDTAREAARAFSGGRHEATVPWALDTEVRFAWQNSAIEGPRGCFDVGR